MRAKNCIIASIAVLIAYLIQNFAITAELGLAMLSVFLICGAGQAINDVFDAKIDAKINKDKPIPSKRITKKQASIFSSALFIIGVSLTLLINPLTFVIALVFSILLVLYASVLYKVKYIGNFVVALGTAFTFIFGAAASGSIGMLIIIFAISAFFANMAREITKDFEDIKKDKGFKKTLPMISRKAASVVVIVYHLLAVTFAMIAYMFYLDYNFVYFVIIVLSSLAFGQSIKLLLNNNYNKAQKKCKKGMIFSLIAFASTIIK